MNTAIAQLANAAMSLRVQASEIPVESKHLSVRRAIVRSLRAARLSGVILRRDPPIQ